MRSIIYACVAATVIAIGAAAVLHMVQGPPGSAFAQPDVRL